MAATHAASAHHGHSHAATDDRRRLAIALVLIVAFMAAEVAAGIIANSLALLSDAGHMLTDAGALGLSLFAASLARRPAEGAFTFGLRRSEILSAQINGITLVVISALVLYGAVRRLIHPEDVDGALVLGVALAGIVVNLAAARVLAGGGERSLNVEGSYRHILTDLYAFIATALAAIVILATGADRADPIASLFVVVLMLHSAWILLRASGRVFMEASPTGTDPSEIGRALAGADGVVEVHDLHVWEVTSGFPAMSAHVRVTQECDCHDARRRLERMLAERFDLTHTTLQMEHEEPQLLQLDDAAAVPDASDLPDPPGHPK
jgi:cobalt-zinc-cadmium efflux system protein